MNNVTLLGRIVRDPETRSNNDSIVTKFTVAVNREFKNSEGKYDADFINCVAFKEKAEFIEKYFHKGMRIALTGRIQTGSYTNKDGQKIYTTDVIVSSCEFCENKTDGNSISHNEPTKSIDYFVNVDPSEDSELPFN